MRHRILFFITSTLLAALPAYAAPSLTPPVVISATRTPTPASQVASSVTVLDRETIEKRQKNTVIELLRDVPGVAVAASGPRGQTARIFIRGTESRHTLVIVDGVVVNDPSDVGNAFDFAYLTTDNVERIEVLRGPQSTLYGADAIGGVINITTRKGEGKPKINAMVEAGTLQQRKVSVGSNGGIERFNYSVNATRSETGGISAFSEHRGAVESDPSYNNQFSGNATAKLTDNLSATVVGNYTRAFAEFDSFGGDSENRTHSGQYNVRSSGNLSLFDGVWTQELGLSQFKLWRDSRSPSYAKYNGDRQKLDWVHNLKLVKDHLFTVGFDRGWESTHTNTIVQRSINTKGAFVQDQFNIGDSFFASVGGRVDDHSTFGNEATFRIAPAYIIHQTDTKLKATYGTGYKAPSLFQLYSSFGNATLQPEKSRGFDIGFEQNVMGDTVSFGSTWFRNDIQNLIDYDFATSKYNNIKQARTRGLESFITWRPTINLTLTLNHTFLLTQDGSTTFDLVRRPKHKISGSADLNFDDNKGNVMLSFNETGKRDDFNLAFNRDILPSYFTVDLDASYKFAPNWKLYGRVENLLDKQYEEVFSYGTPGINAVAGVRTEF